MSTAAKAKASKNGAAPDSDPTAPEHKTLAEALLAAQEEMPAVEPDQENPHFKSRFVSLGHLLSKIKPVLNRHGIVLIQAPATGVDGQFVLRTILKHAASGEAMEFDAPLSPAKNDPQGQGSAITYMRRYAAGAALAIADQEDDDGNGATPAPQARAAETAQFSEPPPDEPRIGVERVEQLGAAIGALKLTYGRIGQLLSSCQINGLSAASGQALRERIESLTDTQASKLEAALELLALDAADRSGVTGG